MHTWASAGGYLRSADGWRLGNVGGWVGARRCLRALDRCRGAWASWELLVEGLTWGLYGCVGKKAGVWKDGLGCQGKLCPTKLAVCSEVITEGLRAFLWSMEVRHKLYIVLVLPPCTELSVIHFR